MLGILQTCCQCIFQTAATQGTGATERKDHDNDYVPCVAVKNALQTVSWFQLSIPLLLIPLLPTAKPRDFQQHSDCRTSTQMRWQSLGRLHGQALNKNSTILKWGPQVKVVWQNWYSTLEKAFICAEGLAPIYTGIRTAVALNLSYSLPNMLTINVKNINTV